MSHCTRSRAFCGTCDVAHGGDGPGARGAGRTKGGGELVRLAGQVARRAASASCNIPATGRWFGAVAEVRGACGEARGGAGRRGEARGGAGTRGRGSPCGSRSNSRARYGGVAAGPAPPPTREQERDAPDSARPLRFLARREGGRRATAYGMITPAVAALTTLVLAPMPLATPPIDDTNTDRG